MDVVLTSIMESLTVPTMQKEILMEKNNTIKIELKIKNISILVYRICKLLLLQ